MFRKHLNFGMPGMNLLTHFSAFSAKEKEIIYHDSACFVLGRSGTGARMPRLEVCFADTGTQEKQLALCSRFDSCRTYVEPHSIKTHLHR